jgi:hypothetical protein
MRASEIFSRTLPFCMAKLLLGLLTTVASAAVLAILMGIAWLFNAAGVTGVLLIVWLGATGVIRFLLMHYVGYLVKAGHIAVIAEAVTTGHIPENQVAYGKKMVLERFATSNVYFAVDKLVAGAVRQLQGHLQRAGNALDAIPGMTVIVKIGKLFLDISLGYIDECCLGYTFHTREQGAFKSAADGVALYTQNWKTLLSGAAKTTLLVLGLFCAVTLVSERFATSNVYFAVDKLVAGAVRQLQGRLQRVGNAFGAIPGMAVMVRIGKLFLEISLGYIDECCLGYTFHKRGQGAFKSAADGVVLYTQNWQKILRGAAKTTLLVLGVLCAVTLVAFVSLGLLCKLFGLPGYLAFLIACLIAFAVKFAFIDSYVLVNMMVVYMEAVPSTQLSFDLYGKLCAVSSKFTELY